MLQKGTIFSFEEYLGSERTALNRHEYFNGGIYEREGESLNHGRIKVNVCCLLANELKGNACEAFVSGLRVCDKNLSFCFYPDVLVICGKLEIYDNAEGILHNPKVIIEVLSSTTEAYDRGEKFASYRQLESLTDYLLISQDKVRIEHYVRHGKFWLLAEESDLANSIVIESIECSLPLKDVYARVRFPTKEPPA